MFMSGWGTVDLFRASSSPSGQVRLRPGCPALCSETSRRRGRGPGWRPGAASGAMGPVFPPCPALRDRAIIPTTHWTRAGQVESVTPFTQNGKVRHRTGMGLTRGTWSQGSNPIIHRFSPLLGKGHAGLGWKPGRTGGRAGKDLAAGGSLPGGREKPHHTDPWRAGAQASP